MYLTKKVSTTYNFLILYLLIITWLTINTVIFICCKWYFLITQIDSTGTAFKTTENIHLDYSGKCKIVTKEPVLS